MFRVISNTRDSVSSRISKHLEVNWKFDAQRSIFDEIPGVWITDETLSRVLDISSQSKQKLWSKWRSKIVKLRPGIETFTVVIFFDLTWWIINVETLRIPLLKILFFEFMDLVFVIAAILNHKYIYKFRVRRGKKIYWGKHTLFQITVEVFWKLLVTDWN